jgi:hypothetical protein
MNSSAISTYRPSKQTGARMPKKPQLSRSAIEQHMRCPRCFYLHRKLKIQPPSCPPLTLAVATDALLKNEFDAIRGTETMHPLWVEHGLNVRAYPHEDIDNWRNNFKGMRTLHKSGIEIFGAVDDVWQDRDSGELVIVDYKSTSKQGDPSIDEGGWGDSYKRQMEIYQWLFRQAGHTVSNTGYFLYVNGLKDRVFYDQLEDGSIDGVMRFKTTMIAYEGNDDWVESAVDEAIACLDADEIPESGEGCDVCSHMQKRVELMLDQLIVEHGHFSGE